MLIGIGLDDAQCFNTLNTQRGRRISGDVQPCNSHSMNFQAHMELALRSSEVSRCDFDISPRLSFEH